MGGILEAFFSNYLVRMLQCLRNLKSIQLSIYSPVGGVMLGVGSYLMVIREFIINHSVATRILRQPMEDY